MAADSRRRAGPPGARVTFNVEYWIFGVWMACIRVASATGLPVSGWCRILACLYPGGVGYCHACIRVASDYPGGVGYWLAFIRVVLDAGMPLSGWCVMLACLDPGGGGCWHAVILERRVMGSVFGWFVGAFEFCTCACAAGCVPRAHASACRVPLSPPRVPVFLGFRVQNFFIGDIFAAINSVPHS